MNAQAAILKAWIPAIRLAGSCQRIQLCAIDLGTQRVGLASGAVSPGEGVAAWHASVRLHGTHRIPHGTSRSRIAHIQSLIASKSPHLCIIGQPSPRLSDRNTQHQSAQLLSNQLQQQHGIVSYLQCEDYTTATAQVVRREHGLKPPFTALATAAQHVLTQQALGTEAIGTYAASDGQWKALARRDGPSRGARLPSATTRTVDDIAAGILLHMFLAQLPGALAS